MNKKNRKKFEALKKEMLINLLNKESNRMPLLIKKPSGLLTEYNVESCKLISNEAYLLIRRERYLQGLNNHE